MRGGVTLVALPAERAPKRCTRNVARGWLQTARGAAEASPGFWVSSCLLGSSGCVTLAGAFCLKLLLCPPPPRKHSHTQISPRLYRGFFPGRHMDVGFEDMAAAQPPNYDP